MAKKTPTSESAPAKFPAKARKRAADSEAPEAAPTAPPAPAAKKPARAAKAPEAAETATPPQAAPSHDAIRQRAYEIWRAHGGAPLENWLRAEAELRGGR